MAPGEEKSRKNEGKTKQGKNTARRQSDEEKKKNGWPMARCSLPNYKGTDIKTSRRFGYQPLTRESEPVLLSEERRPGPIERRKSSLDITRLQELPIPHSASFCQERVHVLLNLEDLHRYGVTLELGLEDCRKLSRPEVFPRM